MMASHLLPINVSNECTSIEMGRVKVNDILFECNACMGLASSKDENLDYIATAIKELKHERVEGQITLRAKRTSFRI